MIISDYEWFIKIICGTALQPFQLICFASDACQAKLLTLTNKDDDGTKKSNEPPAREPF